MKTKAKLIVALKIWIVIYPSITLFLSFFGETLLQFPLYIRTLILTLSLVPWMVFVGVPFVDLIIRSISSVNEKNKTR